MIKKISAISVLIVCIVLSCKEEDPYGYEIEYQNGYPTLYAGSWRAVDFLFADGGIAPVDVNEYSLVTALDPADNRKLIIDNIYNSNLRVRTNLNKADDQFYISRGEQLEKVNNRFDVEKISIQGYYFDDEESGEIMYVFTGLYDQYGDLFDTIVTIALRKSGFEDIDQYEYDYIFDNSND